MAEENRIAFSSLILSDNFNKIRDNLFEVSKSQMLTLELMRKVIHVQPELVVTQKFITEFINHLNRENSEFVEFCPFIQFFNEIIDNYDSVIPMLIDIEMFNKALELIGQFEMVQFIPQITGQNKRDIDLIYLYLARLAHKLITYKSSKLYFKRFLIEILDEDFILIFNKFTQYFFTKRASLLFIERYNELNTGDSDTVDRLLRSTWSELDSIFSNSIYNISGLYLNMLIVRAIKLFDKCSNNLNDRVFSAYLKRTDKLTIRYKAEQLGEDMSWSAVELPFRSSFITVKKEVTLKDKE